MSSAIRDPQDHEAHSFAYHAQAVGFAASLTRPCYENIPSLATASLSMTGGESYSTVKNYNWKGLISFDEASAYATGSKGQSASKEHEGKVVYNTLSTVTVKNLNVANMVHADLVVARVTSKHYAGEPEAEITFAGSTIQNLVIAGHRRDVVIEDDLLNKFPTYARLSNELQAAQNKDLMWKDPKQDLISCSLVKRVGDHEGFMFPIPEFGPIYVAHVLMKPSYRRISMLRFELGCPIGGSMEAAGGETNGAPYWP
jgi:hypothetical protein